MVAAEWVAARFIVAKSEVKDQLRRVVQYTPRIEALVQTGDNQEAVRLYNELAEPIRAFTTALAGVVIQRKDEQRKLTNLKELLLVLGRLTNPQRWDKFEPDELSYAIHLALESLAEKLQSLARIESRLDDYKSVERSFSHGPFRILNDYGYRATEYEPVLKMLDEAASKIQAAGYSSVLYGEVALKSDKGTGRNAAGVYYAQSDHIVLNVEARYRFSDVYTLIHEFGHRYWYKVMTEPQRDAYEAAYSGTARNLTVADREAMYEALKATDFDPRKAKARLPPELQEVFSDYWKAQGSTAKPSARGLAPMFAEVQYRNFVRPGIKFFHFESDRPTSVTDYGRTNVREDFAEVFAHEVTGKTLTPDAYERFAMATRSKTARRIARRFLLAQLLPRPRAKVAINISADLPSSGSSPKKRSMPATTRRSSRITG